MFQVTFRTLLPPLRGSTSSLVAGGVGTISKAIGLLVSGFIIAKFKPNARFLSGWNVVLGVFYFVSLIAFSSLGCPTTNMYGEVTSEGITEIDISCNNECACPVSRPRPICSKDGLTNFYSPCHAGCKEKIKLDEKTTVYKDCSCVLDASTKFNTTLSDEWIKKDHFADWDNPTNELYALMREKLGDIQVNEASEGWCEVNCDGVYKTFMLVMFLLMVLSSTGRIGNALMALRCVDVQDKALSMAFIVIFMSLFAMLPAPMVYGAIIDNTCILWQKECGQQTNCLLYDTDSLRKVLMLTTAFIMLIGVFFDVAVCYYAKDIKIFHEEDQEDKVASEASDKELLKATESMRETDIK